MRERQITVSFPDSAAAADFIRYIEKRFGGYDLYVVAKGAKVRVIVKDTRPDVAEKIKQIAKIWRTMYGRGGGNIVPLQVLLSMAELKTGIPIGGLLDVLRLMGLKAELKQGYLLTSLSLEQLAQVARRFSEEYSKALRLNATSLTKRLVAVLSTATGNGIEWSLERLLELNIVKLENNKYILKLNYESALAKLGTQRTQ